MKIRYFIAAILVLIASPLYADEREDLLDSELLEMYEEAHRKRMKTDPAYRHRTLGNELAKKRQFGKAAEEFRQAIRYAPGDAFLHAKLGHALVGSQHPREALKALEKSISMSSGKEHWLYWAYLHKGTALGMVGNMDAAIAALTKSISLKPTVLAHVSRGAAYAQKRKLDAALRDYEAALRLKPDNAKLWLFKARLHLTSMAKAPEAGHMGKACRAMRKACDLGECRPLNEFNECKAQ